MNKYGKCSTYHTLYKMIVGSHILNDKSFFFKFYYLFILRERVCVCARANMQGRGRKRERERERGRERISSRLVYAQRRA